MDGAMDARADAHVDASNRWEARREAAPLPNFPCFPHHASCFIEQLAMVHVACLDFLLCHDA